MEDLARVLLYSLVVARVNIWGFFCTANGTYPLRYFSQRKRKTGYLEEKKKRRTADNEEEDTEEDVSTYMDE
ncbi:hypothetical protein RUM44_012691 [Polyplax serrata]|uniref:Uncharacterized protein n=1 Tax=Polyplax serrata TaxID=468196 RepID=A0ABR1BG89_POLSC